jgi:hypothetical protein
MNLSLKLSCLMIVSLYIIDSLEENSAMFVNWIQKESLNIYIYIYMIWIFDDQGEKDESICCKNVARLWMTRILMKIPINRLHLIEVCSLLHNNYKIARKNIHLRFSIISWHI